MILSKNIPIPTRTTLKKYGMNEHDFMLLLEQQGYVCPICKKLPKRFVIDHYHHPKYKKLPDNIRRSLVRGALCWFDNYYSVARGITVEKAQNIVEYLKRFETRKSNGTPTKNHT